MHLLSEIHFWSTCDDILIKHTEFSASKYFPKKESNDLFYHSKKFYCEQRGVMWNLANKRPNKIKDRLKELEECLLQNKVVCISWTLDHLQLLLAKGIIVNVTLNANTNNIEKISINKSLTTKIQTELICDGAISGKQIACICTDGRVFCQGGIWRDGWVIDGGTKKRISLQGEWLCVWGRVNSEHPQPWSPLAKDHQRANLLLYWVGTRGPELYAHKKTEGEPITIIVSKVQNKVLISVEQKVSLRGAVSVEVSILEVASKTLKRTSITAVPLPTQVSCCSLSGNENRLVLGCIDGSIALLDRNRGSTHIVKGSIIPTFALWHMYNTVIAISNEKGQVQYFDTALNRINTQLNGEDSNSLNILDLSGYFNIQPNVSIIAWVPNGLVVVFEQGPVLLVTHLDQSLTLTSLARRYLKMGKLKKTIELLLSWEWEEQSFRILQQIVACLLKLPLTDENAQYLKSALSYYHSPVVPLSTDVKHKYGFQIHTLTRRFFHQLVRYKMFETAFLLAVDIGHHDLFMDLYYCATQIGEKEMAAAARAQASALLSRCSSEASCCSRSSCSQCSDSYTDSESESNSPPVNNNLLLGPTDYALPRSQISNENYLTTNFNDFSPKTYNSTETRHNVVSSENNRSLPNISTKSAFNKVSLLSKISPGPHDYPFKEPTLPKVPPLPIAPSLVNRNFPSRVGATSSFNHSNPTSSFNNHSYTATMMNNQFWNKYEYTPVLSLPEPSVTVSPILQNQQVAPASVHSTIGGKKQQAKVKFSDTVTAFIVPEVKRPVRPPPPPHITDPRRELADSLPLCHPNEDYLKDFAPVRHNESDESCTAQSKIKVIHFGVV